MLRRALLLAACLAAALPPPPAVAGSFAVVPIRLNFGPRDRALAVTLTNKGDTVVALQAELYAWTQGPDGADQLTPTDDLALAPPIIRLAPQAQQVVRLALLRPIDPQRQLTYRIIVREVPEAGPTKPDTVAIPVAIAMSLPVFVTPPIIQRDLECKAEREGSALFARCNNPGNVFVQVRDMTLKRGADVLARFAGGAYVLPQVTRRLKLEPSAPATAGPAQLEVTFDDERVQVFDLVLP